MVARYKLVKRSANHARPVQVVVNRLSAADCPSGTGRRNALALHKKTSDLLNAGTNGRRLRHGRYGQRCIYAGTRRTLLLPLKVAKRVGHTINVLNRQTLEVWFLNREQVFFNLPEPKVHPPITKMIAVMKGSADGNAAFEAGNKFSGIALDSLSVIEAQPKFGMVEFATPG